MSDPTQPIPQLKAGQAQDLTIKEAVIAYGVSADTLRRAIKREQNKKGSGLVHEQRKSDRGVEYVLTSAALEAFGFKRIETRSRVQVATVDLQAESMRAEITELRAKLEVQTIRAEYATKEAERLKEQAESATENLRIALTRIPAALPPAPPSLMSRLFSKSKTEEKPTT